MNSPNYCNKIVIELESRTNNKYKANNDKFRLMQDVIPKYRIYIHAPNVWSKHPSMYLYKCKV